MRNAPTFRNIDEVARLLNAMERLVFVHKLRKDLVSKDLVSKSPDWNVVHL
jgi:hypothetical protein